MAGVLEMRGRRWQAGLWGLAVAVALGGSVLLRAAVSGSGQAAGAGAGEKPAVVRVSGLGFFENRIRQRTLQKLWPGKELPPRLPAGFIEDACLMLRGELVEAGFLRCEIDARLQLPDGGSTNVVYAEGAEVLLPPDIEAVRLELHVRPGVRYHLQRLEFDPLDGIPAGEARRFFHPTDSLILLRSDRPYSPARFERSRRNLEVSLRQEGHRRAKVTIESLEVDDATGRVRARVGVRAGPLYRVRRLVTVVRDAEGGSAVEESESRPEAVWSAAWESETIERLRRRALAEGYPDVRVSLEPMAEEPGEEVVWADLRAVVVRGPRVRLGEVRFEGLQKTSEALLRRKVRLEGPWLNRIEADRGRTRLSQLGVFKSVLLDFPEETNGVRDVRYRVEEGRRIDLRLLAGYGSYDQLFGGAELDLFNLWGRAHSARLYGVQSFKSTQGRLTYSVPDFLAPELIGFGDAELLRREELTFERQEVKLTAGLRRSFASGQNLGLRYAYEFLRSDRVGLAGDPGETQVAAVIADWTWERRNNPLLPREGWRAGVTIEAANPALGGSASYQRIEASFSWHRPVARATYLHVGFWHGVAADLALDEGPVPFNKRFFPGGETSIRGYEQGGASPRDATGRQLGAEAAWVGNFELEQALTRRWSVVGFLDVAGVAEHIEDYPAAEWLYSVGGGIRYATPVGALRLEYGHNLNPRRFDPAGTLHVSLGHPF
ncbi:MAG: hypothetical protein D6766_11100 [Verrucomicrobia bacterium]|nr:MAG: hypothetical protein D6766_11100 [Verrucomicrobiota bacterium]